MEFCGVKLKMSASRHPRTDGTSEIKKRMVENYLRSYCTYHQNDWDELLPGADFAMSEDLSMSPLEVDLGWKPKSLPDLLNTTLDYNESREEFKKRSKLYLDDAK